MWHIVAFVTLILNGSVTTEVVSMDEPFQSFHECNNFIETQHTIAQDIEIMYPKSSSYNILCLSKKTIQNMRDNPKDYTNYPKIHT